ncbi:MAG: chlorophyllase/cutinase-like alpha/beta fold protein [Actinomycetota bacterium]
MKRLRWCAVLSVIAASMSFGPAPAAPIETWTITHGIDCLNDLFNPIRPDGTRDPARDPLPGSPEWLERDRQRLECDSQRDHDRRAHPHANLNSARYGEDWYRQPIRFDGRRWRYTYLPVDGTVVTDAAGQQNPIFGIPGVPAAEIYRPCAPNTCGIMPPGLQRIAPPYPVVVIHHGFIAQMTHHRFNAQVYAEAGYMAIVVQGTHPLTGAPNVQDPANGGEVIEWLASPRSGEIGREADLTRVAMAGHSMGAAAALSYQGDPRVDTIVAWDGGDGISDNNCTGTNACQPIMYQRTDGAFSAPQNAARAGYPQTRARGLDTYQKHKTRGLDVYHVTLRATNHIDWNGNGVGSLAGNRLAEPVINYYTLAWLDRHLMGKLIFDGSGNVVTSGGRTVAEERGYRQSIAQSAFDRLTAMRFPAGSIDRYNISQGFYDPVQHVTSGDVLFGGNVPYTIEGLWTGDRIAQEFYSYCAVSVPDYVNGSSGAPGSPVAAGADATDIRITGCR